ncbi:MAG TPA: hypothetical protein EYP10_15175 [Armatimonadetes bacterium]|nr:hypothetical protein [Armatimonadota bacterium]
MSRGKLDSFISSGTRFVAEQIGVPDNEFKEAIVGLFRDQNRPIRAYLAQVEYGEEKDFNVALCIASEIGGYEKLASDIASVFRRMFGSHEHLDILFLSSSQETELRKVCCPFFSSRRFDRPDFYLTSSEGYGLEEVRACYKERRFLNGHPDGYLLCEVDPPILGQPYGLGGQDIHRVVLASRHAGHSVFTINDWPTYVHVARLTRVVSGDEFIIAENDIESIGWAEIYESSVSAQQASVI